MCLKARNQQWGFALPAAIFVVVAFAGLIGAMLTLSTEQNLSTGLKLQSMRAIWAAKSGIEWGAYAVAGLTPGSCFSNNTLSILGFSVSVTCSVTAYAEASASDNVYRYQVQSSATPAGLAVSDLDYVYRSLEANFVLRD